MNSKGVRTVVWGSLGALALMGLLMVTGASAGPANRGAAALLAPGVVSNTLSYQGRLLQGSAPINDSRILTFRLYTDTIGVTPLWSQLYSVTVNNGLFDVNLDVDLALFNGQALWLGVQVQGDAQEMAPRQPILPAPYALYAKSAPWSGLMNVPPDFADGVDNDSPHFAGPGLNINGTTFSLIPSYRLPQGCANGQTAEWNWGAGEWVCGPDDVGGGGTAWLLTGNAGTTPGTHFLGTTDNVSLTLRVNNAIALRLVPNPTSPNLLGGHGSNSATPGIMGTTIGGGGSITYPNRVLTHFGAIGGGQGNTVGGIEATVGGGFGNTANGQNATVSGGWGNVANNWHSTVGGGLANTAGGDKATIGGGHNNVANSFLATIGGGYSNTVSSNNATIGGGVVNAASGEGAAIGGGEHNTASGYEAAVGGGWDNTAGGDFATIGGGVVNDASSIAATVGGGNNNTASGNSATVSGGFLNAASGSSATVGGGGYNTASGVYATVPGGAYAAASLYGQMAYASGAFGNETGNAQTSVYVLRNVTTDTTQTELFLDGGSQRLTVAISRTVAFEILIVARSVGGDSASYRIRGVVENHNGTMSLLAGATGDVLGEDVPAWDAVAEADNANKALVIKVTGGTGSNVRWVATVRTTEVGW